MFHSDQPHLCILYIHCIYTAKKCDIHVLLFVDITNMYSKDFIFAEIRNLALYLVKEWFVMLRRCFPLFPHR